MGARGAVAGSGHCTFASPRESVKNAARHERPMARLSEIEVATSKEGMHDITAQVQATVRESGVMDGVAVVMSQHTTAGVTINENADPDVQRDMLLGLRLAFPDRPEFRHSEGNSSAHLRASAVGSSVTVVISGGRLTLGTWQGIYLCEFDGPRRRKALVKIIEG